MTTSPAVTIALAPHPDSGTRIGRDDADTARERHRRVRDSVIDAGGTIVDADQATGLVWLNIGDAPALVALLDANPGISWVQLPWAGVDSFLLSGLFDREVTFTSAKGAFADQLAEHALMLTLMCLRHTTKQARTPTWCETEPESLHDQRVTILGGGGIAQVLVGLMTPLRCRIVVVRRQPRAIAGAEVVTTERLRAVLPDTDVLMLALALTPETKHIMGATELGLLPPRAVVVNVARGQHIDTDALVEALRSGRIAGAGLDVTDPEPLPQGHPLWAMDNVIITSHCADSLAYVTTQLAQRVGENVGRLVRGEELIGVVDAKKGY